jgi:fluoride exporter
MLGRTLLVGGGGAIGASLRYLLGGLVYRYLPETFPYATFLINVTGCFAIGFLAVLFDERAVLGPGARVFWIIGVLGGYTTFSSFGYETMVLMKDGSQVAALTNVLGQVVLGLTAVWLGAVSARALL